MNIQKLSMFSTISALIVFCQLVDAGDSSFIDRLVGAKEALYERYQRWLQSMPAPDRYRENRGST